MSGKAATLVQEVTAVDALSVGETARIWAEGLGDYLVRLEGIECPEAFESVSNWLTECAASPDAAAWAKQRRKELDEWRRKITAGAEKARQYIRNARGALVVDDVDEDALSYADMNVTLAKSALLSLAGEIAIAEKRLSPADAQLGAIWLAMLGPLFAQVGESAPSRPGRPPDPANDWAFEQLLRGRPRREVFAEWKARSDVAIKNLVDHRRYFDKVIRNREKKVN